MRVAWCECTVSASYYRTEDRGSALPCRPRQGAGWRVGFQRLSYCADCEIIKGRAQTRGFSVAQLQDSFEASTVPALFGDLFSFMVGGTRFDGGAGGAAPGFPAPREAAVPPQLGCEGQPPGASGLAVR